MATTVNKQKIVTVLFSKVKKASSQEQQELPVMEQVIYSICREGSSKEQADAVYQKLTEQFFDWNELRVSSVREIEECFHGMTRPVDRAARVIGFLQELFETTYSFELEFLHKKGLKQATKHLSRYQISNDYLGAWVTQRALGGHAIPIDTPTMRVSKRLGLVEKTLEQVAEIRNTLEHLIPKSKGVEFTDLISTVGTEYCHDKQPDCSGCPLSKECQFALENSKPAAKKSASAKSKSK
ncbi:hypothetical protein EBX93_03305 [bacterium]|nr:hypothetical protein [bacterium]